MAEGGKSLDDLLAAASNELEMTKKSLADPVPNRDPAPDGGPGAKPKEALPASAAPSGEGAFVVSNAEGPNAEFINGVFEPTGQVFNDAPVFKMKGGERFAFFHRNRMWRLGTKEVKNSQAGCAQSQAVGGTLPTTPTEWRVLMTQGKWEAQNLKVEAVGAPSGQPADGANTDATDPSSPTEPLPPEIIALEDEIKMIRRSGQPVPSSKLAMLQRMKESHAAGEELGDAESDRAAADTVDEPNPEPETTDEDLPLPPEIKALEDEIKGFRQSGQPVPSSKITALQTMKMRHAAGLPLVVEEPPSPVLAAETAFMEAADPALESPRQRPLPGIEEEPTAEPRPSSIREVDIKTAELALESPEAPKPDVPEKPPTGPMGCTQCMHVIDTDGSCGCPVGSRSSEDVVLVQDTSRWIVPAGVVIDAPQGDIDRQPSRSNRAGTRASMSNRIVGFSGKFEPVVVPPTTEQPIGTFAALPGNPTGIKQAPDAPGQERRKLTEDRDRTRSDAVDAGRPEGGKRSGRFVKPVEGLLTIEVSRVEVERVQDEILSIMAMRLGCDSTDEIVVTRVAAGGDGTTEVGFKVPQPTEEQAEVLEWLEHKNDLPRFPYVVSKYELLK